MGIASLHPSYDPLWSEDGSGFTDAVVGRDRRVRARKTATGITAAIIPMELGPAI